MSARSCRFALLSLLVASPLLIAEECIPVPPEDDPVLVGSPEVIARLEADHGPAIQLLRDYHDRSEGDDTRFRIREDSLAFAELGALQAAIPRLERIVAVDYHHDASPEAPFCGEGGEVTSFELDLVTRGLMGKPVPHVVNIELCRTEDDGPDSFQADLGELVVRDEAWVTRVLRRAEAEAVRQVDRYQSDRLLARHAVLGSMLGCPEGTSYAREQDAHFCASSGVKHGPYIKGDLTETLVGPRLVEGTYLHGKMHGTWTQYDADGRLLSTTEWQHGERVGWGGGF